ncbi:PQQ-binding-like beta-propeller repeat protein [Modestobacter sp. I12A-02628]|uniref:PQQ-binding-like beta-propeller repeat protein n=1 Tax=Goekera deserti TaxID=2497753 RepID=A0A7K3WH50_9ACTN|nr:PQQ-binding-like beta-propeller repeat protein [Goekera deserti]MPQ97352.1 PQQ-binding-like beta-propeller repeat protein [Goekera deserti]NDI50135.1 PQQ-binding-like beta-propeller repeat protein [Goekera deserti]NEL55702.1 PQQ-binding-like beta-propeller repeat protein [Goekera deserti]
MYSPMLPVEHQFDLPRRPVSGARVREVGQAPDRHPVPAGAAGWVAAGAALAAAAGVETGLWLPGSPVGDRPGGWLTVVGTATAAVVALVAVLAAVRWQAAARDWAWVALAGALLTCWASAPPAERERSGGFPGAAFAVTATSAALLVLSLAVVLAARGERRPRLLPTGAAAAAAVLVALPAVVLLWSPERGSTTAAGVDPAPVPATVASLAWTRSAQAGQAPRAVVAAGAGIVLTTVDGVTALDGVTGAQRWTYRRPGAVVVGSTAASDGGHVFLRLRPGDVLQPHHSYADQLVVLDAVTGSVRWQADADGRAGRWGSGPIDDTTPYLAVDDVLVRTGDGVLAGLDWDTGDQVWQWAPPPGCRRYQRLSDGYWAAGTGNTVVLTLVCRAGSDERVRLVALDATDGSSRWSADQPPGVPLRNEIEQRTAVALTSELVVLVLDPTRDLDPLAAVPEFVAPTQVVLDVHTGRELRRADAAAEDARSLGDSVTGPIARGARAFGPAAVADTRVYDTWAGDPAARVADLGVEPSRRLGGRLALVDAAVTVAPDPGGWVLRVAPWGGAPGDVVVLPGGTGPAEVATGRSSLFGLPTEVVGPALYPAPGAVVAWDPATGTLSGYT